MLYKIVEIFLKITALAMHRKDIK